jgi:hypothetical protein
LPPIAGHGGVLVEAVRSPAAKARDRERVGFHLGRRFDFDGPGRLPSRLERGEPLAIAGETGGGALAGASNGAGADGLLRHGALPKMRGAGKQGKRPTAALREIVQRRLDAQLLASSTFNRPADVVARLGAVQAQDYLGALWAVGVRLARGHEQDVERALAERTIVRSWPLRGTLHFVAAADARWMIEHFAPKVAASAANRLAALGIDGAVLSRARRAVVASLEGGRRLSRPAVYRVLERARISAAGERGLMVLWRLAHEGLVCLGPREGKQHTVVLLDEWIPPMKRLQRDEALGELGRRYFTGHGPATAHDFAWWAGLTLADARRAIDLTGTLLVRENIADDVYWSARGTTDVRPRSHVALALPAYDEFFVGYANRQAAVDRAHAKSLSPFDLLGPLVLVDDRVVATWSRRLTSNAVTCSASPLAPLSAAKRAAVRRAVDRYASFLRREAVLKIV